MESGLQDSAADRKLCELILYITSCCLNYGNLGATRLNKILFYSDFAAYLKLGKSITGQEYFALQAGPAPRRLLPVREQMLASGQIETYKVKISEEYQQQLIVPQRKPELSQFTADEIAIVDQVMVRFFWKSPEDVSDESHNFIGWLAAELQETIPYSSALLDADHILGSEPLGMSKDAVEHARRLEDKAKKLREQYA